MQIVDTFLRVGKVKAIFACEQPLISGISMGQGVAASIIVSTLGGEGNVSIDPFELLKENFLYPSIKY